MTFFSLISSFSFSLSEFYYIQMEKYARAALAEGVKSADDIHITIDSELYRLLNLHYNRNNHIDVRIYLICGNYELKLIGDFIGSFEFPLRR